MSSSQPLALGNSNPTTSAQAEVGPCPLPASLGEKLRVWQRFHVKLIGLYGGTVLIALALTGFLFYKFVVSTELQGLQERILARVTSLAVSVDGDRVAAIPLEATEMTPLHQEIAEQFKQVITLDPDIETIYIFRPTDEPPKLRFFVEYAKEGESEPPGTLYNAIDLPVMFHGFVEPSVEEEPYADEYGVTLSGYAPIFNSDGKSIGIVGADVEATRISAIKHNVLYITLGVFGIAILLISLVSMFVARSVREPLSKIIDGTAAIAEGKFETRMQLTRADEFGLMCGYLDKMAKDLQEHEFIRETFGRYMSKDVVSVLLAGDNYPELGGEERVVSVLLSDLRGYTAISEQLPPAEVVKLLNQYLEAMNEVIDAHRGCVIEFLGDSILTVFGAPNYLEDHEEKAVYCALEMRRRLQALNEQWKDSKFSQYWSKADVGLLDMRIGIHTGCVIAGNLGCSKRMKYAVIGDTVNLAARLESLNKKLGTSILVSGEVRAHLPEGITRNMVERGEHKVKGREQPVHVYSL